VPQLCLGGGEQGKSPPQFLCIAAPYLGPVPAPRFSLSVADLGELAFVEGDGPGIA
jgi:hypothetical protein